MRYSSDAPLSEQVLLELAREFETVIRREIRVELERVESIPRTATGKYLTTISELSGSAPTGFGA